MTLLNKDYLGSKAKQKKQMQAKFTLYLPYSKQVINVQMSHCLARNVGL